MTVITHLAAMCVTADSVSIMLFTDLSRRDAIVVVLLFDSQCASRSRLQR